MRHQRIFTGAAALVLAATALVAGATSATATTPATQDHAHTRRDSAVDVTITPGTGPQTVTLAGQDKACVTTHEKAGDPVGDACDITASAGIAPSTLTAADLAAHGQDRARNGGPKLVDAQYALTCDTWWQKLESDAKVWGEKHIGKRCWNGTDVWIWAKDGYHYCDKGYGIGYDIKVTTCSQNRVASGSTYFIQQWDYFKVYFLFKGFPINNAWDMHANVWPNGGIGYHWCCGITG